ncbi:hypothetical protein DL766_001672 [Monosporascus sp. MC13-8B]|uniref:Uncharacterized protein n=1 Tax=Monosporascus cannonballus TaxID=155416 RepID=A0ABY0H4U7_9PEZI|nr:hypothetical protein DL762_005439 [Monosporascus cannonballus]RYO91905.1 hypothetical protein DL763_004843 [Monosporascus cannonballus]RYP37098.1 hypothetical protein DL766_001672 [Monosporascus sp. MC13-8B]
MIFNEQQTVPGCPSPGEAMWQGNCLVDSTLEGCPTTLRNAKSIGDLAPLGAGDCGSAGSSSEKNKRQESGEGSAACAYKPGGDVGGHNSDGEDGDDEGDDDGSSGGGSGSGVPNNLSPRSCFADLPYHLRDDL